MAGLQHNRTLFRWPILKHIALLCLFLGFTYLLFTRYLLVFLYSVPTKDYSKPASFISIKEALHLSSSEYGILSGPAFMTGYAIINSFSGWVGDNWNRKYIVFLSVVLSALSTAILFWVNEFWQLCILRLSLSASQAFFAPLGISIISSYYTTQHRVTANAFFTSGVYAGYGLATLTLIILPIIGWRALSCYIGIVGGLFSIIFFIFVQEPQRDFEYADQVEDSDSQQHNIPSSTTSHNILQDNHLDEQQQTLNDLIPPQQQPQQQQRRVPNPIAKKPLPSSSRLLQTSRSPAEYESLSDSLYDLSPANALPHFPTAPVESVERLSLWSSITAALPSTHMWIMIIALIFRFCGGAVLGSYFPLLVKYRFEDQNREFALINAGVVTAGGILSGLLGGMITDRWVTAVKASNNARLHEIIRDDNSHIAPTNSLLHIDDSLGFPTDVRLTQHPMGPMSPLGQPAGSYFGTSYQGSVMGSSSSIGTSVGVSFLDDNISSNYNEPQNQSSRGNMIFMSPAAPSQQEQQPQQQSQLAPSSSSSTTTTTTTTSSRTIPTFPQITTTTSRSAAVTADLAQISSPVLHPMLFVASFSCLLSLPLFAAAFFSNHLYMTMISMFCAYLVSESYFSPVLTFLYSTNQLQDNVRGTALSLTLGVSQFISSFSPVLVGIYDDHFNTAKQNVSLSLSHSHDAVWYTRLELICGVLLPNAICGCILFITAFVIWRRHKKLGARHTS